jgi:hypothetical protein
LAVWGTQTGIAVQANGLRALRALGLNTAIERNCAVLRHWQFCDQQGIKAELAFCHNIYIFIHVFTPL